MPDREPRRDHDLERELSELGSQIEFPPTPDLARAVRRRLEEEATRNTPTPRRSWATLPALRWAAAAVFVLVVAVPVLSPEMRGTVAGWFVAGQAPSTGEEHGSAGEPDQAAREEADRRAADEVRPASGDAKALGGNLGLGKRVTLGESGSDGPLLLPRTPKFGEPEEVYSKGGSITIVYRPGPGLPPMADGGIGLLLTQRPGTLEKVYLADGLADKTEREQVRVDDRRGYWIPDGGRLRSQPGEAERLPGGALLWESEDRALLMRAALPKEEAIRIAESVR